MSKLHLYIYKDEKRYIQLQLIKNSNLKMSNFKL